MTNMELFIVLTSIGSPVVVGLFIWFGVTSQIKANEKNISKQVKEELEKELKLLDEKINKEKEARVWNKKFEILEKIVSILPDGIKGFVDDKNVKFDWDKAFISTFKIKSASNALFIDDSLNKHFKEIGKLSSIQKGKSTKKNIYKKFEKEVGEIISKMKNELDIE